MIKSFKRHLNESSSNLILYHGTTSNFDINKGLLAGGNIQTTSNFNASNGELREILKCAIIFPCYSMLELLNYEIKNNPSKRTI